MQITPKQMDVLILAYAKAADGIGCERGSCLYDEIARGLTAVFDLVKPDTPQRSEGHRYYCSDACRDGGIGCQCEP
jgi:hypothetical protein